MRSLNVILLMRVLAKAEPESQLDDFCHNEMFDLLANLRRRYVLYYLSRADGPVRSRELAEQIAAWENGLSRQEIRSSQYQSVYNSLYQTHIPQLEAADLLEYDRSENLVYPTDGLREVELFMNSVASRLDGRPNAGYRPLVSGVLLGSILTGTVTSFLVSEHVVFAAVFVSASAAIFGRLLG